MTAYIYLAAKFRCRLTVLAAFVALAIGCGRLAAATITLTVSGGNDDATAATSSSQNWTEDKVICGVYPGASIPYYVGAFRFAGVPIPRGTTILNAWLRVQAYLPGTGASAFSICGEAYDSSSAFNLAPNIGVRALTTAQVAWNIPVAWEEDGVYTSPNIKTVVQEIVNRSGWAGGNALAIQLRNTASSGGYQLIYAIESAANWGASPAQLIIEYDGEAPTEPGVAAENYIPGATEVPAGVPLYLNNPGMYYPAASGGLCWASATAVILAYWDRTAYAGVRYWNLFDHGTAPLREPVLPTAPGHAGADVKSVVEWLAHQYYGLGRGDGDAIIREFTNDRKGLSFSVTYCSAVSSVADKTAYLGTIKGEIDAGRPISIGSYGSYFGGGHQVPVWGYKQMSNTVESTVYIHRNTGGTQSEYVNFFAASWAELDMDRIVPGGTPVDVYEASGDNSAANAVSLDPDAVYGFRQTHNFSTAGDTDWIRFNAVAGRRYIIGATEPGPAADAVLTLFCDGGMTEVKRGVDSTTEPGASRLEWNCWKTGTYFIRMHSGGGRYGHGTYYHLEMAHAPTSDTLRPPGRVSLERYGGGGGGVRLAWEGTPDRRYTVFYSTNLQHGFSVLQSNVFAVQDIADFLDAQAPSAQKFYRIRAD